MVSEIRNSTFSSIRVRRLLQCGTAIPLALLAAPTYASSEVVSSGDVSTSSNGAPAIIALGEQSSVVSTGTITTTGDVSAGIGALRDFTYDESTGQGTFDASGTSASVTNNGNITTGGEESYGIAAGATNGIASIETTGTIATAGDYSHGIVATGGDVVIELNGGIATAGYGANGILVADFAMVDGEAEIVGGISGDITITGGSVSTAGIAALGVHALSSGGNVKVTLDSVATSGQDDGFGNFSEGVLAASQHGTVTVTVGSASAQGFAASGVVAIGGAGAAISADETQVAGQHSAALYAYSASGAASVDAGVVTLTGDQQAAVNALAYGGAATVNVDSIVGEGTLGNGIYAEGTAGVSVLSGAIDVQRHGITAFGLDGSDVVVVTTGDTTTELGHAIYGSGANVSVTTAEGAITQGGRSGIRAVATSGATIINGGTAAATAGNGSAVHVTAPGAVSIVSAAAEVTGAGTDPGVRGDGSGYRIEQGGIIVEGGDGPISVAADSVHVDGEHRYGISVRGSGGIDINAGDVTLASADSVAVVARGGLGDVSITTGAVTTTGASGVGVYADSASGDITINAGTTRVENEGMAGSFTGDAVVATSDTGNISINSESAFSAALYGSAVVGLSEGSVSIVSGDAVTSGDGGVALYALSRQGNASVESGSVVTSGADSRAISVIAFNGAASSRIGDVTATGERAFGVLVRGREANVVVDGSVQSTLAAVSAQAAGGRTDVLVNGSVASSEGIGVLSVAQDGLVEIATGASITGGMSGVTLVGGLAGGFTQLYNSGTVIGGTGPAVVGAQLNPDTPVAHFYIQNNGSLSGGNGRAVLTGAGNDTVELTNLSLIAGIVDLGAGGDRLVLDFNDDAPAGAVGQVAATTNVEELSVNSGSWRAEGVHSTYEFVEIEHGTTLTVAQNDDGALAIEAASVELEGVLNLDLRVHGTEGDFSETTIFGAGSLHLIGAATVELTDASGLQHTGGTFVENGELLLTSIYGGEIITSGEGVFQLGNGGTTGDFTGDIVNNGTFVYARSDSYELLGSFTGAGALVKNGGGTLTFGGFYDFIGTTTINGGAIAFTGQLDENTELDLSGDGVFDLSQVEGGEQTVAELGGTGGTLLLGSTSLTINQATDTSFGGSISGDGTLTKAGEGDLKLEGDSDFSGTADVVGGTLSVNGSFQDATFNVAEGGTLGGNGTVGDTSIEGGTLAAGNSIGELNVAGDLTFTAGSVLEVEVDPAGNADLINVTGTATLGNATVNVLAGSGLYGPVTDYTILTAENGISGQFGTVHTNLAYLVPLLSYTVDTVSLRLSRNDVDFSTYAATSNQATVGTLIESLEFGTPLYNATLVLARNQVAANFETLTGGVYPTYGASLVETAYMLRRQAAPQPQAAVGAFAWGTGLAGELNAASGDGVTGFKTDNTGAAGGLGYAAAGFNFTVGLGKLWQDPDRSQISDSDVKFALAQASYDSPVGLSARAGVQFGWINAAASRNTTLGTISATVSSALDGEYTSYFGEIGYALPMGVASIGPFAGLSHVSLDMDRFTEVGGATALTVDGLDRDVTFADLGLRLAAKPVGGVSPYLSGAYRRAWGDRVSDATIAFAGNSAGETITGLPIARSAAEVEAGIRYSGGVVDLELGYTGSFSKTFDSNSVKVSASVHF